MPNRLVPKVGEDTFMIGSDWPHAEGVADPMAAAERAVAGLDDRARANLLGANAAWLLGLVTADLTAQVEHVDSLFGSESHLMAVTGLANLAVKVRDEDLEAACAWYEAAGATVTAPGAVGERPAVRRAAGCPCADALHPGHL